MKSTLVDKNYVPGTGGSDKHKRLHGMQELMEKARSGSGSFGIRFLETLLFKKRPIGSFEVAMDRDVGARDYQEDFTAFDLTQDNKTAICVLADGMGGHVSGDVASEMASNTAMKKILENKEAFASEERTREVLLDAINSANSAILKHLEKNSDCAGMGTTAIAAVLRTDSLQWVSVGDSPLYLYRDKKLYQINEDHSLTAQIDQMAELGLISHEDALDHPDRNCLTSALTGETVAQIDLRKESLKIYADDLIVLGSDGLQFLSHQQIANILKKSKHKSAQIITDNLLRAVRDLNHPHQDNVSAIVVKPIKDK